MRRRYLMIALALVAIGGAGVKAGDHLSTRVESALARANENAAQLRMALDDAPKEQQEGVRFLVAYMPERDLRSLSRDFLLNNVRCAYQAWKEAPWKDRVPKQVFLNDVLPYASINERRDDWRADFYQRFKPLVADAESPARAAVILNQKIFGMLKVRFSRERPRPDQSPYQTIEANAVPGRIETTCRTICWPCWSIPKQHVR